MEDCNTLIADCVVISCCCQCLLLQIFFFFFLRLPCKLIWKTKEFAKKKLQSRRKKAMMIESEKGEHRFQEEFVELHRRSISIQMTEEFPVERVQEDQCCVEEVEKVLDEFSLRGEFAFGSFWRREGSSGSSIGEVDIDIDSINFVHYELIELGSLCKSN